MSSTSPVGSPLLGARAGRQRSSGGGRRTAAARLAALVTFVAPVFLLGCGYTEFEWQAQLDKTQRLQRNLQASEQHARQLEEEASRSGITAPAVDEGPDAKGADPGGGPGAQRGEPAGARPPADRSGATLKAFLPLAAGEITVAPRDGRVVVSIPSRLLFKGNRDALSPAGEKTLRDIAAIVRGNEPLKGLSYQIVGHAASGAPTVVWRNNWDVTVAQARAVMLFLAQPKEADLPLARLSLASFADLAPASATGGAPAQQPDPRLEIVVDGAAAQAAEGAGGEAPPKAGAPGGQETYP